MNSVHLCVSSTLRGLVFSSESIQMIQMITFSKTEFTFPKVISEPLGQHLPTVNDSKQKGPLPFMTNDPICYSTRVQNTVERLQCTPLKSTKEFKDFLNHTNFITKSVDEGLLLDVVQETSKDHIHNVLSLNVNVKKNNGKLRLVFNTMFINQFLVVPTFKYLQLHKEGRETFGNSSWTYGIDISQAFYHIEIDPNYRKYLGFFWNGKYYTFVCMSFNTVFGPCLWDRILWPVIDSLKSNKLKIIAFSDNILGVNSPKAQVNVDGLSLKWFLILHVYIIQEMKFDGIGNTFPVIHGLRREKNKLYHCVKRCHLWTKLKLENWPK